MAESKYYIYILKCADNTFYIGSTNNVDKRLATHNAGKGAKYTKNRLPVKLLYFEEHLNKSEALKREYELKQMTRRKKEKFLSEKNIDWLN